MSSAKKKKNLMDNERGAPFRVKDFFLEMKGPLKLILETEENTLSRKVSEKNLQKGVFPVLLWGRKETQEWTTLPFRGKERYLAEKISPSIACIVFTEGLPVIPELKERVGHENLCLFTSELPKRSCQKGVENYFLQARAQQALIPGGLLRIFGLGVLIVGDSGIGKSESALELISRGHQFVSDDVTYFVISGNKKPLGSAPDFSRNFMEIRGLGIINIKEIFGEKSLCKKTRVDLVIKLKRWEEGKEYDRLGLEFPDDYGILGIKVPQIIIPVAPGRSMATLIEVACKVYLCRQKGYHAPQELINKLDRALSRRAGSQAKDEG
jgi:HPr kinase/phosphorylase